MEARSTGFRWALVGILLLINIVNYMDRSLIGILGESISHDLSLSDTELGLVAGGVFTITYSFLGLPAARLSDRGWSKSVILFSVAGWCAMTCLAGFAHNFAELAVTRVGVALGEGGVLPASHALLSRHVDRSRRASAIGLLWVGGTIGVALSAFIGVSVADKVGWRDAYVILGLSGLLLLPLIAMILPGRDKPDSQAVHVDEKRTTLGSAIRYLLSLRSYPLIWIGASAMIVAQSAYIVYSGPFLIRTFGLSTLEVGRYVGLTVGVGATIGVVTGGRLFDWLSKRSTSFALKVPAVTVIVASIIGVAGWNSSHVSITAFCLFMSTFLYALVTAPTYAMAQLLVPSTMRSTSAAVFNIGVGAIGGALGPFVAGATSDLAKPALGVHSLALGLTACALIQMLGAFVLLRAAGRVQYDLDKRGIADAS